MEEVEGFVLINITSPARAAQLKSVSASVLPKYSYLSPSSIPSVTIIHLLLRLRCILKARLHGTHFERSLRLKIIQPKK
jgi:hypothetical protein